MSKVGTVNWEKELRAIQKIDARWEIVAQCSAMDSAAEQIIRVEDAAGLRRPDGLCSYYAAKIKECVDRIRAEVYVAKSEEGEI